MVAQLCLLLAMISFGGMANVAHAQNVLMLATDDPGGNYELSRAQWTFEEGGAAVNRLNILSTPDAVTPEIFSAAPGPYDIVVVLSVYRPIHASNWAPLNSAIQSRLANSFLLFLDGCDGCSPENGNNLIAAINAAGMPSATMGALLQEAALFPLNTASPYSVSFTNLNPFNGGYITYIDGVPADNALYLAPGATIPPATPLVDNVFGLLVPTKDSYGGAGACIYAAVDVTLFTVNNNGRIAPSFIHAATAPDGACGIPTRVTKAFADPKVSLSRPGGNVTELTITVENFTDADVAGANLTDNLPAPLQIAAAPTTTCGGGTLTATTGGSNVSLTNFTIPADGACEVTVSVIWPDTDAGVDACDDSSVTNTITPGVDFNTPIGQVNNPATASLICSIVPPPPPVVSKAFAGSEVSLSQPGDNVTELTITIENYADFDLVGANLTDNFPAPLQIAAAATTTCVGGTLTATVGSSSVTFTNFTIPAYGNCDVTVPVIWPDTSAGVDACDGTFVTNTITPGVDFNTPIGQFDNPASASLSCSYVPPEPPRVSKAFADAEVSLSQPGDNVTELTITIENFAGFDLVGANLTDTFPAPLQIAATATTTCGGGTLTAASGGSSVTLTNFTIPAFGCVVSVPVIWPDTSAGIDACDGTSVTNTITPGVDFSTPIGQLDSPATASLTCTNVPVVVPPDPVEAAPVPATRTSLLILLGLLVLAVGARAHRRIG